MAESSGYLALRWNNHPHIFAKILDDLRLLESYCDVTLSCGQQFFAAHKFVLATCSDYFKEMFSRSPCRHPIIYMRDVTPQDMEALLDFMYKGEVHVAESDVASLLRTAEGLQVKGLAVPDNPPPNAPQPTGASLHTVQGSKPPSSLLPTLVAKRKRPADGSSSKKDDPPRLTPLPNSGLTATTLGLSSPQSRVPAEQLQQLSSPNRLSAPPDLKRIKLTDPNLSKSSSLTSPNTSSSSVRMMNGTLALPDAFSPTVSHGNLHETTLTNGPTLGKAGSEERSCSSDDGPLSIKGTPAKSQTGGADESRSAAERDDDSSRLSPTASYIKEEAFQNTGPGDNDDETSEVLQVDLSEDGSQFIIGPGGRTLSSEREEVLDEDTADGQKKPFVCPLCGHDFTRRDNLANHLKTHTGDRPYMCQYCHKCFSRKDYLKQHERIHTGEKPYQCQQCERAFTRREGLTDHMRCHSQYKEFACDVCSKSFKQKCGLRFHKRNYKH